MSFSILAPELERADERMLKALLTKTGVPIPEPLTSDYGELSGKVVLSVGKAALDLWHHFGLIGIGAHHGLAFTHHHPLGHTFTMVVLQHPATAMQISIAGYDTKRDMLVDLVRVRMLLEDPRRAVNMRMVTCAMCGMGSKGKKVAPIRRPAEWWLDAADGVGLCEDHWRRRASIQWKDRTKSKKPHPSSRAAQLPGQADQFMVAKR